MIIEFHSDSPGNILTAIAKTIGSELEDNTLVIPTHLGNGFIKGIIINPELTLMITQYELKEDLIVKRSALKDGKNTLILSFHNLQRNKARLLNDKLILPSVQLSSAEMDYEELFPSRSRVNAFIILINVNLLKNLLDPNGENTFLQGIFAAGKQFFYEEVVSPGMQDIAEEILAQKAQTELRGFFYKIKIEELIYLLFTELSKRTHLSQYPLNMSDVKSIYVLRDKIIEDFSINPNLAKLARFSGMSESKIKRLFKQIFGASIYNYYQSLRMDRAAYLIREQRLSVSEAGLQIGFSNLSHFSRIFERYKGIKPKKYAKVPVDGKAA